MCFLKSDVKQIKKEPCQEDSKQDSGGEAPKPKFPIETTKTLKQSPNQDSINRPYFCVISSDPKTSIHESQHSNTRARRQRRSLWIRRLPASGQARRDAFVVPYFQTASYPKKAYRGSPPQLDLHIQSNKICIHKWKTLPTSVARMCLRWVPKSHWHPEQLCNG